MRVDANVSVRRTGDSELGTRCEVKNLNSMRSLGRAIEHEARRQVDLIEAGESIRQETRHWNEDTGRTSTLRTKEEAEDYRYFPEPDLVPLAPDAAWVAEIDASLPPLPADRRASLAESADVSDAEASLLVSRGQDALAVAAIAAGADPGRVLARIENDLAAEQSVEVEALVELIDLESAGDLTATQAKQVLAAMAETGRSAADVAAEKGFEAMAADDLEAVVDQAIADHPDEWGRFCAGDDKERGKLTGFFVGQVMRATEGQADGKAVTALLRRRAA